MPVFVRVLCALIGRSGVANQSSVCRDPHVLQTKLRHCRSWVSTAALDPGAATIASRSRFYSQLPHLYNCGHRPTLVRTHRARHARMSGIESTSAVLAAPFVVRARSSCRTPPARVEPLGLTSGFGEHLPSKATSATRMPSRPGDTLSLSQIPDLGLSTYPARAVERRRPPSVECQVFVPLPVDLPQRR
jgi:hypothetical protein